MAERKGSFINVKNAIRVGAAGVVVLGAAELNTRTNIGEKVVAQADSASHLVLSKNPIKEIDKSIAGLGRPNKVAEAGSPPDSDSDSFNDNVEIYLGTDPNSANGLNAYPPDFNSDSKVGFADLLAFAAHYNESISPANVRYDLDGNVADPSPDNKIGFKDLLIFAQHYNEKNGPNLVKNGTFQPDPNNPAMPLDWTKEYTDQYSNITAQYNQPGSAEVDFLGVNVPPCVNYVNGWVSSNVNVNPLNTYTETVSVLPHFIDANTSFKVYIGTAFYGAQGNQLGSLDQFYSQSLIADQAQDVSHSFGPSGSGADVTWPVGTDHINFILSEGSLVTPDTCTMNGNQTNYGRIVFSNDRFLQQPTP